jgi:hypothetical protein
MKCRNNNWILLAFLKAVLLLDQISRLRMLDMYTPPKRFQLGQVVFGL